MNTKKQVSIKEVCKIMKCSRQQFYNKYRYKLSAVPTTSSEIKFYEEDVLKLKKEEDLIKAEV